MASSYRAREPLKIKGTRCTVNLPTHVTGEQGEAEWTTIGEHLTSYIVEEVASASEIDFKYGTGIRTRSGSRPKTGWKYIYEKHDVMVFEKKISGSPITCFMGRGVLDVPLQELADFIKEVENNLTWDDILIEARYLKVLSQSDSHIDYLGYQRFESNTCYITTRRDMLYYVRCLHKEDMYIQAALSVDDPEYPVPDRDGVKRIEVFRGSGWIMEPHQGNASKTLVTYLAHTDLKGIPFFLMNHVLKHHPLAIYYIQRQFASHATTAPSKRHKRRVKKRGESELSSPDSRSESPKDAHSLQHGAIPSACFEEAISVGDFIN